MATVGVKGDSENKIMSDSGRTISVDCQLILRHI